MDKLRRLAVSRVALQFFGFEQNDPGIALGVYDQMQSLLVDHADLTLGSLEYVCDDLGAVYEGDLDMKLSELMSRIDHLTDEMLGFAREVMKAAHDGLVDAAIEGTLDSDANTWHLPSLADAFVSLPEVPSTDVVSDFNPSM